MNKVIKIEKTIKMKNPHKKDSENYTYYYTKKILHSEQAEFEITQTCKTISFKQNKFVCTKKIQPKFLTIDNKDISNIRNNFEKIDFSVLSSRGISAFQKLSKIPELENLVVFESQQQDVIFQEIIGQALDKISDNMNSWLDDWQSQLKNTKLVVNTIKFIEQNYRYAKEEIHSVIQKRKAKLKQINDHKYRKKMQKVKGLLNILQVGNQCNTFNKLNLDVEFQVKELEPNEFVDSLFNQFPQLSDFFDCFDSTLLTTAQLSQLKQLKSQLLPQIMDCDFTRAKDKKKKRKHKNKKNKKKRELQTVELTPITVQNNSTSLSKVCSDSVVKNSKQNKENPKFQQIYQFIETLDIDFQNRIECRVTEEWLQNLERQIRYNQILMLS